MNTPEASSAAATQDAGTAASAARPLVSVLLIAYNQERVIGDAVRSVLAQTWQPTEIIISDDCSRDGTYAAIEAAVRGYTGPHRVITRRNAANEGISAHLSRLAGMAHGELLFVAAGDDLSAPDRCERVVQCWLAHDRQPDLIATDLTSIDHTGDARELIMPDDLSRYRIDDWFEKRPFLVGAAHTWSRRLFERFGPMLPGTAAEDQIMTFRAIVTGGAMSLHEPLVRYRRGGLSGKRRYRSVAEMLARVQQSNRFALSEAAQLQRDAEVAGLGDRMRRALAPKVAREQFIRAMFDARGIGERLRLVFGKRDVKWGLRFRMLLHTTCPAIYAPLLWAKRTFRKG